MKLGSLFDGSGGFPLAGTMCGIVPVWASEIEKYPLKVTAARFPQMQQLGDVTLIDGASIEPVDVITFGSPCQDLSVAGKQKGIHEGERSSLFFEAIRIIHEMREATDNGYPRYAVWENVTGAFSSNEGNDFRAVLQAFCDEAKAGLHVPLPKNGKWQRAGCIVGDGFSVAWRQYDAQFWGVPQRRKRIYLVADFASERAGEILFEREGMRWNPAQGGEAWQGVAEHAQGGAGADDREGESAEDGNGIDRANTAGCNDKGWKEDTSYTLNTIDRPAVAYCMGNGQLGGITMAAIANTLDCMHDQQAVVIENETYQPTVGALCARDYKGVGNQYVGEGKCIVQKDPDETVKVKYIVRRLTPLECCRLQGFPDWWEDGVEGSDSARYKMWGNGIALPCAVDVLSRLEVT